MHFNGLDEEKTKVRTKGLLKSYRRTVVKKKSIELKAQLSGIQYDGMPKSQSHSNGTENALIDELQRLDDKRAELQAKLDLIDKTLEVMSDIDEDSAFYASVLDFRLVKGFSVRKACVSLETKYSIEGGLPEPTFFNRLSEALLMFAEIYPDDSIRVPAPIIKTLETTGTAVTIGFE